MVDLPTANHSQIRELLGVTRGELRALVGAKVTRPDALYSDAIPNVVRTDLELQAADGTLIPALYLRPTDHANPLPPVVAVHQHNGEFPIGKSEPAGLAGSPDMAYGLELAEAGCAVIIPDLACFEARQGKTHPTPGPAEYSFLAWRHAVQNKTLQGLHTRDVSLALTWLLDQPEVREQPAGIIGHSLGGQVTLFAMAADERFGAGVANCGIGMVASFFERDIAHNPAWFVPGILPFGDTPRVASALNGQVLKIIAGSDDPLFPLDGVHATARALPPGSPEVEVFPGSHSFPGPVRERALAWLRAELDA